MQTQALFCAGKAKLDSRMVGDRAAGRWRSQYGGRKVSGNGGVGRQCGRGRCARGRRRRMLKPGWSRRPPPRPSDVTDPLFGLVCLPRLPSQTCKCSFQLIHPLTSLFTKNMPPLVFVIPDLTITGNSPYRSSTLSSKHRPRYRQQAAARARWKSGTEIYHRRDTQTASA